MGKKQEKGSQVSISPGSSVGTKMRMSDINRPKSTHCGHVEEWMRVQGNDGIIALIQSFKLS